MILFTTPKLNTNTPSGLNTWGILYGPQKDYGWMICIESILEYFDIPNNARNIRFTAYDRPGQDRVKFESTGEYQSGWALIEGRRITFYSKASSVILKLLKKHGKFYVGCIYED